MQEVERSHTMIRSTCVDVPSKCRVPLAILGLAPELESSPYILRLACHCDNDARGSGESNLLLAVKPGCHSYHGLKLTVKSRRC
jgi:hypothetical protein